MSYSLANDETIDHGIRRIYTTCIDETVTGLTPPFKNLHEIVHNSRKSFKFMRALFRLMRDPLGHKSYKKKNNFFRDLGREISEIRDLHVLGIILEYISREAQSVRPADVKKGLQEISRREQALVDKMEKRNRFEKIRTKLERNRSKNDTIPPLDNSIKPLLPGLRKIYKKGQKAFLKAQRTGDEADFHEWRKQVKYLLNSYQILANYWPVEVGINGTSLQQLSDYLGEEHDLAVFKGLLNKKSFRKFLNNTEPMHNYVDQKRAFLQRSALNLGNFIYKQTDEEFINQFK